MLLKTLLHIALAPIAGPETTHWRRILQAHSLDQWQQTLVDLNLHRLSPIVFAGLKRQQLIAHVPKPIVNQLMTAYLYSIQRNRQILEMVAWVLGKMYDAHLQPVVWKGIFLVDQVYPDLAMRLIGDVDLAIAPQEMNAAQHIFQSLGFELKPEQTTEDAFYFKHPDYKACFDVHHRVRLFEGQDPTALTVPFAPQRLNLPVLYGLEPNALLVHLTVHLDGHLAETGIILFWVLDFIYVLRRWGEQLNGDRLHALMPDAQSWQQLQRILHFLEAELNEPLPPNLQTLKETAAPYALANILRQRRLAIWGLPSPSGWFRLCATRLGLRKRQEYCYPKLSDLLPG